MAQGAYLQNLKISKTSPVNTGRYLSNLEFLYSSLGDKCDFFDQGKEYRQHFYIYQAHIDIAKGKNFEDKDGNQVEPKVGDVIYLRHEDKKNKPEEPQQESR